LSPATISAPPISTPGCSLPDEADARLRSGIQSEVRRALEFYLSVGATRYIREGEALLAASA